MKKRIISLLILIGLALMIVLVITSCTDRVEARSNIKAVVLLYSNDNPYEIYKLKSYRYYDYGNIVELYLKDGKKITTSSKNVVIYE